MLYRISLYTATSPKYLILLLPSHKSLNDNISALPC